jgi:hypothetical protein
MKPNLVVSSCHQTLKNSENSLELLIASNKLFYQCLLHYRSPFIHGSEQQEKGNIINAAKAIFFIKKKE